MLFYNTDSEEKGEFLSKSTRFAQTVAFDNDRTFLRLQKDFALKLYAMILVALKLFHSNGRLQSLVSY